MSSEQTVLQDLYYLIGMSSPVDCTIHYNKTIKDFHIMGS